MSFVSCQDFSHCNVKCSEYCTQCKAGNRFGSCELLESGAVQHSCWTCRQKCHQMTSGVVFVHVWGCFHLGSPRVSQILLWLWQCWVPGIFGKSHSGSWHCRRPLWAWAAPSCWVRTEGMSLSLAQESTAVRGFRCCQQTLLGRARSESVRAFPGPLVCKQTLLFNLEMGILHLGSRWSRIKPSWMLK